MKKFFRFFLSLFFIVFLVSCGKLEIKQEENPNLPKHKVEVSVKCDENLFFSKYDVDVYLDGEKITNIKHGENYVDIIEMTEGKHSLVFTKQNSSSVEGKVDFLIREDTKLSYEIYCKSDKIKVKEIVTENNSTETKETNNSSEETKETESSENMNEKLESTFPKENARRAVVVAFTNGYSTDVYKKDGNTYDINKFHSYAEKPEYHIKIEKDGNWTAKDEKTWHIENIELKTSYKLYFNTSLDITFDGKNYIISNVSGLMGKKTNSDKQKTDISDFAKGNCPYCTVTPELIKEDRNPEDFKELDEDKIRSEARKVFQAYGKKLFPYGFKCHWIIGLKADEVSSDGAVFFKVEVTIKNEYGAKREAIAEGTVKNGQIIDFNVH